MKKRTGAAVEAVRIAANMKRVSLLNFIVKRVLKRFKKNGSGCVENKKRRRRQSSASV